MDGHPSERMFNDAEKVGSLTIPKKKPKCKVFTLDVHFFNLAAEASRILRKVNMKDEAAKLREEIFEAQNYDEGLKIIKKYVDISVR